MTRCAILLMLLAAFGIPSPAVGQTPLDADFNGNGTVDFPDFPSIRKFIVLCAGTFLVPAVNAKKKEETMFDLMKKTLLVGVGLAALTKDKVEALGRELARKGELSEKEGKELIDDLLARSEQARKDLEAKIEGLVRQAVGKLNVATKEDIAQLMTRVERLEQQVVDRKA